WFRFRNDLTNLPEFTRLVEALREDSEIGPQLDTLVGTAISSMRLETEQIANHFVFALAERCGGLQYDDDLFTGVFQTVISDLCRTEFDYLLIAPMWGLKIESLPIHLKSRSPVEIDQMTDEEIARCLNMNLTPRWFFQQSGMLPVDSAPCI